jgi:hypothetical protein
MTNASRKYAIPLIEYFVKSIDDSAWREESSQVRSGDNEAAYSTLGWGPAWRKRGLNRHEQLK